MVVVSYNIILYLTNETSWIIASVMELMLMYAYISINRDMAYAG